MALIMYILIIFYVILTNENECKVQLFKIVLKTSMTFLMLSSKIILSKNLILGVNVYVFPS